MSPKGLRNTGHFLGTTFSALQVLLLELCGRCPSLSHLLLLCKWNQTLQAAGGQQWVQRGLVSSHSWGEWFTLAQLIPVVSAVTAEGLGMRCDWPGRLRRDLLFRSKRTTIAGGILISPAHPSFLPSGDIIT